MEFQVNTNQVILRQQDQVESGEYNVTECNFTFTNEYDGLTKKAVFTGENGTAYLQTIVDNTCSIPSEILATSQVVEIGVYAYDIENEELVLRYSPEPTEFFIHQGSYKEAQNSTPPTPSEIEQLQSQITTNANNIEELAGDVVDINAELATINDDIVDINSNLTTINDDIRDIKAEQITQNENIQKNTDDITDINNSIGTINQNINDIQGDISDIKAEQITQNGNIQTNANDISNIKGEQITQNDSIQANAQNISNEILNRQSADNNLQSQIDAITVSSDVIDVLGTYQDLLDYDTSHVKANDIIKVLQDSTHNDSMSYYRWVITSHVGAWVYVGSEGPYYTKSETDNLLSAKANSSDVYTKSETYNKTEVNTLLDGKVDKEQGKGLSTNDFTDSYKNQIEANQNAIAGIKNGTTINDFGAVETALENKEDKSNKVTELTDESTDVEYPSAKCVYDELEAKQSEIDNLQQENAELKQDITNMAKAMYKVDGQGSDITLQNTSENKFVEFGLEGRTEQEQLSGKNLLPLIQEQTFSLYGITLKSNGDGSFTITGTSTEEGEILFDLPNPIQLPNETIYVHLRNNAIANISAVFMGDNISSSPSFSAVNRIMTSPNLTNMNLLKLGIHYTQGITLNMTFTPSLELTDNITDYEPYCGGIPSPNPDFPQQIKNVTGNANEKIQNKNLFDLTRQDFENGTDYGETKKVELNLKPNTSYTLSSNEPTGTESVANIYFNGGNSSVNGVFANHPRTMQTDENGKLFIAIRASKISDIFNNYWLQLEQGSTATSYVPHEEQNLPFTFAEGQRAMKGTTLEDDGIHYTRKQVVLDGTENWTDYTIQSEDLYVAYTISKHLSSKTSPYYNPLCSHFKPTYDLTNITAPAFAGSQYAIYIVMPKTIASNSTELKAWILQQYNNSNPVTFEFAMDSKDTIAYNSTQQSQYNARKEARSYDDQTNISSKSDELGFNMNVVAVADANKVIDSLDTRLLALESEV